MNLQQELNALQKQLLELQETINASESLIDDIELEIKAVNQQILKIPNWSKAYYADFNNADQILNEKQINGTEQELALIDHGLMSDNKQEVINSLGLLRYMNGNADPAVVTMLLQVLKTSTMPIEAITFLLDLIIKVNYSIEELNGTVITNQAAIDEAQALIDAGDNTVELPDPVVENWRADFNDGSDKYYISLDIKNRSLGVGTIKNSWQYHYNPIRTNEAAQQIIDEYGDQLWAFGPY